MLRLVEQTLPNGLRYLNPNATKALIARNSASGLNEAPLSMREQQIMVQFRADAAHRT